ncbi:hypothetical protein B0O99DRAFT_207175 [Bisporella sp. PMI_857]|nr:hypothetical protein B0O99DRAFT_207175 [Bisporella sp. PMI_857]
MVAVSRMPRDGPLEWPDAKIESNQHLGFGYSLPNKRATHRTTLNLLLATPKDTTSVSKLSSSARSGIEPNQAFFRQPATSIGPDERFASESSFATSNVQVSQSSPVINSCSTSSGSSPQSSDISYINESGNMRSLDIMASQKAPRCSSLPTTQIHTSIIEPQPADAEEQFLLEGQNGFVFNFVLPPGASDELANNTKVGRSSPSASGQHSDESNLKQLNWMLYQPPKELLSIQNTPSAELESILAPSIQRIKEHQERLEMQDATTRADMTISRLAETTPRFPRRPKPIVINETMDPLCASYERQQDSVGDEGTPSITLNDTESCPLSLVGPNHSDDAALALTTLPSANRKAFRGFSAMFKWKHKSKERSNFPDIITESTAPQPTIERNLPSAGSWIPEEESTKVNVILECVSCLEDFAPGELIKLLCHSYCTTCFQRLIKNALESEAHWPAKCCLNLIPPATILSNIDNKSKILFKQRETEWAIPVGDRIYCSRRTCGAWVNPKYVNESSNSAKCGKCGHKTCSMCRGDFHGGRDCPQDRGIQATLELAEVEGWKRCYSCHALVEHNQGCRHMTCRCRAQFCYICSARWRTCTCTDADLRNITRVTEIRRQNQEAQFALAAAEALQIAQREATEAERRARIEEEERQILLEVDNFIREEDERAAREAEAARIAVQAERQKQEEQRLAAIHARFQSLIQEFELLDAVQKILLSERHEREIQVLQTDSKNKLNALSIKHQSETTQQKRNSKSIIAEFECKFRLEYETRLAEERQREDKYLDELRKYWAGHLDGEHKIRSAYNELQAERTRDFRHWYSYRRAQRRALEDTAEKKKCSEAERQVLELRAARLQIRSEAIEWRKRKRSESIWFDLVSEERKAMLEELQVEEYSKL